MSRSSGLAPLFGLVPAILLLGLPGCAPSEPEPPAESVERPAPSRALGAPAEGALNVLLVLADDLGWQDLSVTGSPLYETPHIDRLAAEGLRFTRAYAAHPRCIPSRVAIFTGRFPARHKHPGSGQGYPSSQTSLARAFGEAGYRTFLVGKWHLGKADQRPEDAGFDVSIGGWRSGAPGSHFYPYNLPDGEERRRIHGLEDGEEGEYLTDRLTDETIALIRESGDQPFFGVLSHYAVHTPLEARPEVTRRYERKVRGLDYPEGPEYLPEGTGRRKMRHDHPVYAAMIDSLDENVGRLLAELDELGLAERTVVVFASDHGGLSNHGTKVRELPTSHAPLRGGKGWLYEGGIRVPVIVRWPGVTPPGAVTDSVIVLTDLYPTLLEIAGLPARPETHVDGRSFVGVLRTGEAQKRDPVFWHQPGAKPEATGESPTSAVRVGDDKLVEWYREGRVELYDLAADPQESRDRSEAEPERAEELRRMLEEWRRSIDAEL